MPFGIDDAIMIALAAASGAGAIFGGQRKQIDPKWLADNFGPQAATAEAQAMFNQIINSPRGQQLITSAAEQGNQLGSAINSKAAASGLTSAGGGASPIGDFATSVGDQASSRGVTDVQGNLMNAVIPVAQQAVNDRMRAYLGVASEGGLPTQSGLTWNRIGNAAGVGLSMMPSGQITKTTPAPAAAPGVVHSDVPSLRSVVSNDYYGRTGFENAIAAPKPTLFSRLRRYSPSGGRLVSRMGGF